MKFKWKVAFSSFIILIVALFGLARLYYRLTDDFRIGNITYDFSQEKKWVVPPLSEEEWSHVDRILDQKFFYIGKGAQCYAFVSEDQQYVLKFFKFKHLKPLWLVDLIPPFSPFKDYKDKIIERKRKKLNSVFDGYELAYREHRQEAQLLFLHLMPTQELHRMVIVEDKMGREHHIQLDEVVFLVQSKGETLRTRLHRQLKQRDVEGAKESLAKILDMYMKEYRKGIYDRDHGVMHNTGFVANEPFHLDVGKFSKDESMRQRETHKKDLQHIVWKMDGWLRHNYPEDHPLLSEHLSDLYRYHIGEELDLASIDPAVFNKRKQ
jgi:hypothetical protein